MAKLDICTEPAYDLLPRIHDLFPEDELPPCLGGSAFHIEEKMLSKYQAYGATRSKILAQNRAVLEAETAVVAAGDQLFLEVYVKVAGSKLRYSVSVDKHDVDFRVFRGVDDVVPKKRVEAKVVESESGEIVCDKPGNFIVNFDNSYSKYRSKQVNFKIQVVEP